MKSKDVQNNPRDPQLWRTGRGAAVLPLFPAKKGARPGNTMQEERKIPIFSSKGAEKRFFTGSGKVEEKPFHSHMETILAWPFFLFLFPLYDA